jgi:hypothetical protein
MAEMSGERRSNRRYPIELPARYRVISHDQTITEGVGVTSNMSSGGIALASDAELTPSSIIEVWVTWPVVLDSVSCVELHIAGLVVRSSGLGAAIQIKRHEFETCRNEPG